MRSSSSNPASSSRSSRSTRSCVTSDDEEHEVVGVEVAADVRFGEQPLVRRVAQMLEAILLEAQERVDRAELVGDEDLPAGTRDARELGDGELGPAHVMQHAVAADEVELRVAERQAHHVGFLEADVRRRRRAPRLEVVHARVDADDLGDVRRECEGDGTGAAAGVERGLVAGERPQQPPHPLREVVASPLLEREPQLDAHALVLRRELARERERLVARRDRPRCPFLVDDGEDTPDLRAGLETELVATDERRRQDRRDEPPRRRRRAPPHRRTRAHRAPTARSSRRNRWMERGEGSSGRRARRSAAA